MSETFTCALCAKAKQKGRSDDEAMAEARGNFTADELAATTVVCGPCFEMVRPELARLRAELDQEAAAAGMSYGAFMRREAAR